MGEPVRARRGGLDPFSPAASRARTISHSSIGRFATEGELTFKFKPAYAVALLSAAAVLVPVSAASADSSPASANQSATVDHYSQGPDGSTVTTTTDQQGNSVFQPFATTNVPFDWTIDYDSTLRGRDMQSSSGAFCESYRSDYVYNQNATPYSSITLIRNVGGGQDDRLQTHTFNNDGNRHDQCYSPHSSASTYHFQYELPNFGYTVRAHGTASRG